MSTKVKLCYTMVAALKFWEGLFNLFTTSASLHQNEVGIPYLSPYSFTWGRIIAICVSAAHTV